MDGAALTVVRLNNAQKLVVPEWRRIRGILQKLYPNLLWLVGAHPLGLIKGCEVPSALAVLVKVAGLHDDAWHCRIPSLRPRSWMAVP